MATLVVVESSAGFRTIRRCLGIEPVRTPLRGSPAGRGVLAEPRFES